jgi:hypothetical protein
MTTREQNEYQKAIETISKYDKIEKEETLGIRPIDYRGPLPRPECNCNGWGCFGCLNNEQEIRSKQRIYS